MQRIWELTAALLSSIIAESGADIETIIEKNINRDSFMRYFNNVYYFQMLEPLSEKSYNLNRNLSYLIYIMAWLITYKSICSENKYL